MRNFFLFFVFLVSVGCTSESYSPQATFSLASSNENTIEARKTLHQFAINHNLKFTDKSHNYPSGMTTLLALAERVDGLQLILLGSSETSHMTVAVHCHKNCKSWENMYSLLKKDFAKKWTLSN